MLIDSLCTLSIVMVVAFTDEGGGGAIKIINFFFVFFFLGGGKRVLAMQGEARGWKHESRQIHNEIINWVFTALQILLLSAQAAVETNILKHLTSGISRETWQSAYFLFSPHTYCWTADSHLDMSGRASFFTVSRLKRQTRLNLIKAHLFFTLWRFFFSSSLADLYN